MNILHTQNTDVRTHTGVTHVEKASPAFSMIADRIAQVFVPSQTSDSSGIERLQEAYIMVAEVAAATSGNTPISSMRGPCAACIIQLAHDTLSTACMQQILSKTRAWPAYSDLLCLSEMKGSAHEAGPYLYYTAADSK